MTTDTTDEVVTKLKAVQHESEHAPDPNNLAAWRTELENSARNFEAVGRQFISRAEQLREKIKAVDILLGQSERDVPPEEDLDLSSDSDGFTPVHAYWPAILESLAELGGRAKKDSVVERVGKKLQRVLTTADKELLPSGMDVRWKNRVAWQRLNMVNQGLLRSDSPRGVWEITDSGHKWLENQKQALSALELKSRVAALCHESSPTSVVELVSTRVPGHIKLKVVDGGVEILSPHMDIPVAEWMAKSDEQLWVLLEALSNTRIRRPV
jgi:hypothetical protein